MSDDIQRSLGQIEAKVDILLSRSDAHDKRLGAVEKKVYWASGVSAVLAYIATNFIGKH